MQKAARAFSRHSTRVLVLLLIGLSVFVSASAARLNRMGALWIAESTGILNVSTDSDEIRFGIPHALGVSSVAVNDINGDLWAYGKKRLYHYTREGQQLLEVDVPPSTHGGDPADMVVDGSTGNLWLAIKRDLYRFDLRGQLQQTLTLPHEVIALGLDRFRSVLWVALERELRLYDSEGKTVKTETFGQKDKISDVAYDRVRDWIWINLADRLLRYDHAGKILFGTEGAFSGAVATDGAGGLWLIRGRELIHLDDYGVQNFSAEPFSGDSDKHIMDLAADPQDASIWVASQRRIRHYAIDGSLLSELIPEFDDGVIRKLNRAALYADLDPPEITITAPVDGSLLNNNRPTFELRYFDLGVGVDADTIAFAANDQTVAVSCNAGPTSASCIPNSPLPEGELQISATAEDFAGNVSEPGKLKITIDTIPPEIMVAYPSPNHMTNQPNLAIRGNLNEFGALTINGASVGLSDRFGFTHDVQLQEGSNAFDLAAVDSAGNQSNKMLGVTLDTVPPAVPVTNLITIGNLQDGTVSVAGALGSVEPGSTVRITNVRTGKVTVAVAGSDGSFAAVVDAEEGDELAITVFDAAGNNSVPVSAQVASSFSLSVKEPDVATIQDYLINVTGDLVAPPNTGVTINGVAKSLIPYGSAYKFHAAFPAKSGNNEFTVVASTQDGRTLTRSLSVFVPASTILPTVTAGPWSGAAPLNVTFNVRSGGRGINIDFNSDGTIDHSRTGFIANVSHIYSAPGFYLARITAKNNANQSRAIEIPILVRGPSQFDQMLRGIWSGMNSALLVGDIPRALSALSHNSRETYGQVFESLLFQMPDILDDFTQIEPMVLKGTYAEYAVMNVREGKARVHIINFIQGPDGVWRIDSM